MLENILWSVGVSVFIAIFIGIPYVKGVNSRNNSRPTNKSEYVLANLDKFGINDNGASLKKRDIYLVSHERMGFKC